jgi:hypothetical protein
MASTRDRLVFRCFRFVEGEAEGRFAISALVALVLAVLIMLLTLKGSNIAPQGAPGAREPRESHQPDSASPFPPHGASEIVRHDL